MGLVTRQIGPNAKGSKLTFTEMDNNLYYLQGLGVSGFTYSANTLTITNPTGGTKSVLINDFYTTAATYNNGLIYFDRNDQLSAYTVNISSLTGDANTFITAATYNQSTNTITLKDNANTNFNIYINAVSGLTVNGILSATTISGGTLYGDGSNLIGISKQDTFVTGGTYSNGTALFRNNTGGTFNVNGFFTGSTDVFVTGGTYSNGTATFTNTSGGTFNVTGFTQPFTGGTVSGATIFTNGLTATTISATTLTVNGVNITGDTYVTGLTFNTSNYNLTIGRNDGVSFTDSLSILASDLTVTGGTYNPNNGTATFTNNTGGTFNVTGFLTGFTDTFVTGGTYSNGTATFTNTSGGTFNVSGFYTGSTDVFVTGGTYSAGTITFTNNTGSTFNINGFYTGIPSVQTVASSATVTPTSNDNLVVISAQSESLLIANPTGSWVEGQDIMIRIKDNGSSRSITYDTNYRAIGVTLPTSTSASKTTYLGIIYNSIDNKWDIIGATTEA